MRYNFLSLAALLALVRADDDIPSCGEGLDACPEKYPCCSVDGTCGNGYVCLGGCDPRFSFTANSCMPVPVCESNNYTFTSADDIAAYADYLGDSDQTKFSYLGNITTVDNNVRITMDESSSGSTVSSSIYVWYGKVSFKYKASHSAGVVSTFILYSGVKDEVDYELVGTDTTQAQTNYYWHGALDYTKMVGATVPDVYQNENIYEIDWKEDSITWTVNGNEVRSVQKSDTYNETSNTYSFPQTPARIQFGLWPAGDSPAEGTADWAGGKIDWSQVGDDGYFYVEPIWLNVQCYDAPSGTQTNGSTSYVYNSKSGLEGDIAITDDTHILGATDGTGLNPDGSNKNDTESSSSENAAFTLSGASKSSSAGAAATLSGASIVHTTISGSEAEITISATEDSSESSEESSETESSDSGATETSGDDSSESTGTEDSGESASATGGSGGSGGSAAASGESGESGEPTATATAGTSRASAGAASGSGAQSASAASNAAMALIPALTGLLAAPFAFFL